MWMKKMYLYKATDHFNTFNPDTSIQAHTWP